MKPSYQSLKADALAKLSAYMDSLDPKRGEILAYWIRDYTRFLGKEDNFDPRKLIRYKRGSVVKAHLGYRIGSEEGGLHYGIVIDNKNAQSSPTATIIPLTSIKPTTDLDNLHPSRIVLGDEIYQKLNQTLANTRDVIIEIHSALLKRLNEMEATPPDSETKSSLAERRVELELLRKQLDIWKAKLVHADKMDEEIGKMKRGSIALVGQITTISKIRIYDPLYPADALSGIRISDESLDRIDAKIKEMFTNNK